MDINNELNARLQHAIDEKDLDGGEIFPSDESIPLRGEVIFHLNSEDVFDTFKLGLGNNKIYGDLEPYLLVKQNISDSNTFLKGDGSWGGGFISATSSNNGKSGLVPAPPLSTFNNNKVLLSNATWGNVSNEIIPNLIGKTYNNINLVNNSTETPQPTKTIAITGNVSEEPWVLVLSNNQNIIRKILISQ